MKLHVLAFLTLAPLILGGCATSHEQTARPYTETEAGLASGAVLKWTGKAEFTGEGGAVQNIEGIDFYAAGTPAGGFTILSIIQGSYYRGGNAVLTALSEQRAVRGILDEAKAQGADAVVVISREFQALTTTTSGHGAAFGTGNWAVSGYSENTVVHGAQSGAVALVKYIKESDSPNRASNSFAERSPRSVGTAFFITEDGYLISNAHVVRDAQEIRVKTSDGEWQAKTVKLDVVNDLALLKTDGHFSPLPIASSRTVQLGSTVVTVGFPNVLLQGFAPKFARGEIAALSGIADDPRCFQISTPVQPGNSGGALVDERGNVVGVVSAKLDASAALAASGALPENVNYAVKSSFLLSFLESTPQISAKLKEPHTKDRKLSEVVDSAEQAAALLIVY
jgi:S1-C subfamily serine protease